MLTNDKTHVALPVCEHEVKDLEPIIFHAPATYNEKVKVHDWQMQTLAEPRDNKEIFPPKGNLYMSSYKRLGPEVSCTGVSETQAMLSQIELKDLYKPLYPHRTLLKMESFASAEADEEKEATLMDIMYDAEEARCMDYRTTMEIHYRSPYPMRPRARPPSPPPQPWLLNRRTIGYSLDQLEKRNGTFTFLDDNMELHKKIADLKQRRYKLHSFQKHQEPPDLSGVKECKVEN